MIIRRFYEELGLLLYAICKSDGEIQSKETRTIDKEIDKLLAQYQGFEKNSNVHNLLLTKINFYNAVDERMKPSTASKSFSDFIQERGKLIDAESRTVARNLIERVASAYGGIRPEEKKLLDLL